MNNFYIIDSHAHVFPTKIANKAVKAIGEFYGIPMTHDGSTASLIASGSKIGTKHYVVHSTATHPEQVASINQYIHTKCLQHPEFIGFGTLHPDLDDFESELLHIEKLGLKGIKLHPDFQEFSLDSPKAMNMFAAIAEFRSRLPVLVHLGDARLDTSRPSRLARVLDRYPTILAIGAHLGGYTAWEEGLELLAGRSNLYLDTSSTLPFIRPELAVRIIRTHGADNILFGSDYPMWDHSEELDRFLSLPLTGTEQAQILGRNAARLFSLPLTTPGL